jgi:hypothetical protein
MTWVSLPLKMRIRKLRLTYDQRPSSRNLGGGVVAMEGAAAAGGKVDVGERAGLFRGEVSGAQDDMGESTIEDAH